jgi:hypothetical protein
LFLKNWQLVFTALAVSANKICFYEVRQIKLGAQVWGIDLKANISEEIKQVNHFKRALDLRHFKIAVLNSLGF